MGQMGGCGNGAKRREQREDGENNGAQSLRNSMMMIKSSSNEERVKSMETVLLEKDLQINDLL